MAGIFGKLMGLAVAVGAGYATVKIAKKYDENKKNEALNDEINEIKKASTFDNIKKAAGDVYVETADKVKTKVVSVAQNVGIDTEEMGAAFSKAGDAAFDVGKAVAHASVKVAEKVVKETPTVIENVKEFTSTKATQVKDVVGDVADKFKKPNSADAFVYDEEYEDGFTSDEKQRTSEEDISE